MILVAQGTVISSQQYMNIFLLGPSDYNCQDSGPLLLQVLCQSLSCAGLQNHCPKTDQLQHLRSSEFSDNDQHQQSEWSLIACIKCTN